MFLLSDLKLFLISQMMLLYRLNNLYYLWIQEAQYLKYFYHFFLFALVSQHNFPVLKSYLELVQLIVVLQKVHFILFNSILCKYLTIVWKFTEAEKCIPENCWFYFSRRFTFFFSIQFCLNTCLFSLAQFFQKFTEAEKSIPENSQSPSGPRTPGNTCSVHCYKGAQLSQHPNPPLWSSVASKDFLCLIGNVCRGSKFPQMTFLRKYSLKPKYALDTLRGKEYPYALRPTNKPTGGKGSPCLGPGELTGLGERLRLLSIFPSLCHQGPREYHLPYSSEISKQAIKIILVFWCNYGFLKIKQQLSKILFECSWKI